MKYKLITVFFFSFFLSINLFASNHIIKSTDFCDFYNKKILENLRFMNLDLPNVYGVNDDSFDPSVTLDEEYTRQDKLYLSQQIFIKSINNIDELRSQYEINYQIYNSWSDDRLSQLFKDAYIEYETDINNNYSTVFFLGTYKFNQKIILNKYPFDVEGFKKLKKEINKQESLLTLEKINKYRDIFNNKFYKIFSENNSIDKKYDYLAFIYTANSYAEEEYLLEGKYTDFCPIDENLKNKLWSVSSDISNSSNENLINKRTEMTHSWINVDNDHELWVSYETNNTEILNTKLDFKSYPFDLQNLKIEIINNFPMAGIDIFEDEIEDFFDIDPEIIYDKKNNTLYEWNITQENINYKISNDNLNILITAERNANYFIFKVFSPILLILIVCWSILFIEPKQLESRLTVSIVCFLTLIAYNFVIDEDLPKLGYLTLIDYIVLISYLYSAIPTLISIFEYKVKDNSKLSIYNNKIKIVGVGSYILLIFISLSISSFKNPNANTFLKAITL